MNKGYYFDYRIKETVWAMLAIVVLAVIGNIAAVLLLDRFSMELAWGLLSLNLSMVINLVGQYSNYRYFKDVQMIRR